MTLFATKPIAALRAEAEATGEHALVRALGPLNLVTLGIGAVIGAGIFVITGQVAALYAGPAVPLSMVLVGVACAFAGLCYAEMASAVPVAGSAYTYAYATMGEFAAWIIGWDLVLEYAAGAATVGVGWSGHFVSLLGLFGVQIPAILTAPPTQLCTAGQVAAQVTFAGMPWQVDERVPPGACTVTWNVVVPSVVGSPKRSPEACSVIPDGTWLDDHV